MSGRTSPLPPPKTKTKGTGAGGCGWAGGLNPEGAPPCLAQQSWSEATRAQGHALGPRGRPEWEGRSARESLSGPALTAAGPGVAVEFAALPACAAGAEKPPRQRPSPGHCIPAWGAERRPCSHSTVQDPKNPTGRGGKGPREPSGPPCSSGALELSQTPHC